MKNPWARLGAVLGIVYCIAGFVLIFLGWNGTASNDREAAQLPYVVSGGIAGLALVVVGAALIVAHSLRADRVELRAAIDDLRAAVERGGGVSGGRAPAAVAPAAPAPAAPVAAPVEPVEPPVEPDATAPVEVTPDDAAVDEAVVDDAAVDEVVVGNLSYHRPDCAVVAGQEAASRVSTSEAIAAGLAPCRVCRPDRAGA